MTTKEKPKTLSEALAIFQSQVKSADRTGIAKETRKGKNGAVTTERKYSTLEDVLKSTSTSNRARYFTYSNL